MCKKKICDKCTTIKNSFLSPAIMYTTDQIETGNCNLNCKNDKKPNLFITRLAILISAVLLVGLLFNFLKG